MKTKAKLNSALVRSASLWSDKLDDNSLIDIVHCITTSFSMTETEGASVVLASIGTGIQKTIEKRFDEERAESILNSALGFANDTKSAILNAMQGAELIQAIHENQNDNCNDCEKQNDCGIKSTEENSDFNIQ